MKKGIYIILLLLSGSLWAQDTIHTKLHFLDPALSLHKGRIIGVSSSVGAAYSTAMIGLNELWYKNYPRGKFHFFNDNGEWNQMDKVGHTWTAYVEGMYMTDLLKWSGVPRRKAVWIGGASAWFFQASIELLDGFSEQWGASAGDLLSNTLGSALMVSQELLWEEQRILLKFSSHPVNYNHFDPVVRERTENLYGATFLQKLLKDYNGQTYWLSFNPVYLFNQDTRFPAWLNFSFGYGVEDIYGGFENSWFLENGEHYDLTHLPRLRQYYFSIDIDFSKIKTRSRFLKLLFKTINVLKIPAPTLEFNSKGQVKFHPFYW